MKELTAANFVTKDLGTSSAEVRRLWQLYFPDLSLSDTRYYEKYEPKLVEQAMQITAEQRKANRFDVEDDINLGKYINRTIQYLQKGKAYQKQERWFVVKSEFCFTSDYEITPADRGRFAEKLTKHGSHWLYGGASTTDRYKKFWVNGESRGAHYFAFFAELGYLPKTNALGGQEGLQVAHKCGLRACCNPKHLRLTTKGLNLQERRRPLAVGPAPPIHCANSTDYSSTNAMSLGDPEDIATVNQ